MSISIVPIVEGYAEVESVPVLLRRILNEAKVYSVKVARPFRVKRNQVVKAAMLERAVTQAIRDRENAASVLVLLDADDDCPAELGPELMERCRQTTQLPAAVVLANKEFEAWFLGAKESLRGVRGIWENAVAPANPEGIRGAKERLSDNIAGRSRYLEVVDQPALAAAMDIDLACSACASFRRLCDKVVGLVHQVSGGRP